MTARLAPPGPNRADTKTLVSMTVTIFDGELIPE